MISGRLLLILSLVFLQEGITYYLSFQVLALFILVALVLSAGGRVRSKPLDIGVFLAFAIFLTMTALYSPLVISAKSSNIFFTTTAVLVYAAAIFHLPLLHIRRPEQLLLMLQYVSTAVILILAGILLISESTIVPFLTRETMIQQNERLIDNFSAADAISMDILHWALSGESGRNDLFYGEPSFLAVVLFACLGCQIFTSKLLTLSGHISSSVSPPRMGSRMMELATYLAIVSLLYIESLSSIIYALLMIYFLFVKQRVARQKWGTSMLVLVVFGVAFGAFSYDYFLHRLTMGESLSFAQRFGLFFELDLIDVLKGIGDVAKLPAVGIHNGLLYIIAVSGIGGLVYLLTFLRYVYRLAEPLKLAMLTITTVLAIIMQNGGVFSPNKVVLLGLVLLPLSCSRTIRQRNELVRSVRYSHA